MLKKRERKFSTVKFSSERSNSLMIDLVMYKCFILNLKGRTHALKTWSKVPFVYFIFMSTFGSVNVTSVVRD